MPDPSQPAVLLVRHGQSTWNAEHRWAGHADPPLSPHGRDGAAALARRLAGCGLTTAVASDLRRASETAAIVAGRLGLGGVRIDPRLREWRCPAWSGLTSPEIEERFPGMLERWRQGDLSAMPAGSEPWGSFVGRVVPALEALAAEDGRRLVVAHAGVLRAVASVCGLGPAPVANLEGRWLTLEGGRLTGVDALGAAT
jgi:probable phosphoglycerate mutase